MNEYLFAGVIFGQIVLWEGKWRVESIDGETINLERPLASGLAEPIELAFEILRLQSRIIDLEREVESYKDEVSR